MSTREVIAISEIVPAKSVVSLFDGTAMLYIANPYFKDCPYDSVKDDILKPNPNAKNGYRLQNPQIYLRKDKHSGFNRWYILAWKNKTEPKTYYIYKPFINALANLSTRPNIRISIGTAQAQETPNIEDDILASINYQLLFATEILLIARMFGINLKEIHSPDNKEFLTKFGSLVNEKILSASRADKTKHSQGIKVTPEYIVSFVETPIYKRMKETWYPVDSNDLDSNKPHFLTMMEQVKNMMNDVSSKYPLDHAIQKIIHGAYCVSFCPPCKTIVYENKNHELKTKFDVRGTVWLANQGARMPTKIQKSPTKTEPCTPKEFTELYGGTLEAPNLKNFCKHTGCIFFQPPKIDNKYYNQGQPELTWSIDKFTTKKIDKTSGMDYDYGNEIFDGGDEYNAAGMVLDRDEEEYL